MRFASLFLLIALARPTLAQAHVTKEPVANDGTVLQLDLPLSLHMRNTRGTDRAGLCVWTSLNHSAYWQNIQGLQGIQKYMTHLRGGGWPSRVDDLVPKVCASLNAPTPSVLNIQNKDLEILKLATRLGRMPGVTYSFSPTGHYGGRRIAHMVTLVGAGIGKGPDGKGWWCVLDNNYPDSYEWMSENQFLRTYTGGGQGWCVIFGTPAGPPPVPFH